VFCFFYSSPACQTHDATSKTGELYVTLSSWQAYNPVEGTVAVYMEEPNGYITSAQLDVVRSIYDANCANRLAVSLFLVTYFWLFLVILVLAILLTSCFVYDTGFAFVVV
tara:strand:+ start:79 stop:408 length:330 start_codon:yes stop_codon:yes gene_type:complete